MVCLMGATQRVVRRWEPRLREGQSVTCQHTAMASSPNEIPVQVSAALKPTPVSPNQESGARLTTFLPLLPHLLGRL